MSDLDFPVAVGEVTAEWVTRVLHAGGHLDPAAQVSSVSVAPLGAGAGFMGSVSRLELRFDGTPGPVTSVIAKFAAADSGMREIVRGYRNYEREVGFFRQLAAELDDRVPACYAVEFDEASNYFVLLLEDLAPAFRDGDQVAGCDLAQTRACLDVQIDLHARYWDARARPDLAWVPRVDGEWFVPTMMAAFAIGWTGIAERFPELVPDPLTALGADFRWHLPALMARLGRCPQTLVHSDFRLDNVMFGRADGPVRVKVLDWQGILISAGVHDVAFLLSQNIDESLRREHERELLGHYLQGLLARGIGDYGFDALWDDYRLAVLFEWVYAVVIGGSLPMSDERSRALFAAMVRRSSTAIADLDALALLPALPR